MSDPSDRRSYERFDLLAQVRVRSGNVDYLLEVVNLSRGGALIDLGSEPRPAWLELLRTIEIRLLDPAEGSAIIDAKGRVVRIVETLDSRTFALEFEVPVDEDTLRRTMRAAGMPPPLPRTTKP